MHFFPLKDTGASIDTIGVFNARIILIKIKIIIKISRIYYFCNTSQVSKNNLLFSSIAIFFLLLFPLNNPKSRDLYFAHYIVQFSGCASQKYL